MRPRRSAADRVRSRQVGCVLTHALRPPTRPAKLVRQAAPYVLGRHAAIEDAEEIGQPFGGGADVSAAHDSPGRIAEFVVELLMAPIDSDKPHGRSSCMGVTLIRRTRRSNGTGCLIGALAAACGLQGCACAAGRHLIVPLAVESGRGAIGLTAAVASGRESWICPTPGGFITHIFDTIHKEKEAKRTHRRRRRAAARCPRRG